MTVAIFSSESTPLRRDDQKKVHSPGLLRSAHLRLQRPDPFSVIDHYAVFFEAFLALPVSDHAEIQVLLADERV